MFKKDKSTNYALVLVLYYALMFMTFSTVNTYLPIFLKYKVSNSSVLGLLMSIAPLVAVLSQPLWGLAADRSKSKNSIIRIIIIGSAICSLLFPFTPTITVLIIVIILFSTFYYSLFPLSDTITLEFLQTSNVKFGPIRLAGTYGFALMSIIIGIIADKDINLVFLAFFILAILILLVSFKLPTIKGHQHKKSRISILNLLKYKQFVIISIFYYITMSSMGFYYAFFPIYYESIGASRSLLGVSMFLAASSETPFLLYASKLFKKVHSTHIMLFAGAAMGLRWFLLNVISNKYIVLPIMLLHGLTFIVLSYAMATYVNENIPRELKASGQSVNWVIALGLSRITGSFVGGIFIDICGIKQVFLYNAYLVWLFTLLFGIVFHILRNRDASEHKIS